MLNVCSVLGSLLFGATSTAAIAQAPNDAALAAYGGFAGLSKMTQDFVERIQKNPSISRFFKEADTERLHAMLSDQFCGLLHALDGNASLRKRIE